MGNLDVADPRINFSPKNRLIGQHLETTWFYQFYLYFYYSTPFWEVNSFQNNLQLISKSIPYIERNVDLVILFFVNVSQADQAFPGSGRIRQEDP